MLVRGAGGRYAISAMGGGRERRASSREARAARRERLHSRARALSGRVAAPGGVRGRDGETKL